MIPELRSSSLGALFPDGKEPATIEIVSSSDTTLSSMSNVSRRAILAVLSQHYTHVRITLLDDMADLESLVARKPDLVFLGMKFIPKNPQLHSSDPHKIWISEYLDLHNIAYTGSGQSAHYTELNKEIAKQAVRDAGVQTASYYFAQQNKPIASANVTLQYPVFIKPSNRGGGSGIDAESVADDFTQLSRKVAAISSQLNTDSLIEELLPGREFSVAVLKHADKPGYDVMPIELTSKSPSDQPRILSKAEKSSNTSVVLPVNDNTLKAQLCTLALAAFHALGARDYGRIDIRMDANGTPNFLEANLIPSIISGYGSFPIACMRNKELAYEPMILRIVRLGFTRAYTMYEDISSPSVRDNQLLGIHTTS